MSAYRQPGKRKVFAGVLKHLASGHIQVLVAIKWARLSRNRKNTATLFDMVSDDGIIVATADGQDTTTRAGRLALEIQAMLAREESEETSERVKLQREQAARAGKYGGGGRPFGFEGAIRDEHGTILNHGRIGIAHVEEEAATIREATRRLLTGEPMGAVVRDFRDRKIVGPKGALLTTTMLRQILCNPRIAGIRVHRGQEVGKGAWEPIISEADFRKVRGIFTGRARGGRGVKGSREAGAGRGHRYAYSGLLECSHCQGRLFGSSGAYVCSCRKTYVTAKPFEEVMDEIVIAWITSERFRELLNLRLAELQGDPTSRADLDGMRAELDDYRKLPERFQTEATRARTAELEGAVQAAEARMAAMPEVAAMLDVPTAEVELRAAWASWSVEQKRAKLASVLERVIVKPATRRGGAFDDSRIDPQWKSATTETGLAG
jgi:site-specific DNA recombinase